MCSSVSIEGDNPPWRQKILQKKREIKRQTTYIYRPVPHLRTQPYLIIYQCGEGQIVKQICEVLPNIGISVFPQTLVVEAVHLCDLSALVVPSENCDSFTKSYLQTNVYS